MRPLRHLLPGTKANLFVLYKNLRQKSCILDDFHWNVLLHVKIFFMRRNQICKFALLCLLVYLSNNVNIIRTEKKNLSFTHLSHSMSAKNNMFLAVMMQSFPFLPCYNCSTDKIRKRVPILCTIIGYFPSR